MSLHVITPATEAVVSLAEAKAYLRVDHDDDDTVITTMVAAVTDWTAGPDGWLGRSLVLHTLELRQPSFPAYCYGGIILPRPPFNALESIVYLDTDSAEQTLSSDVYTTYKGGDGLTRVSPVDGESWPATADHPEAVKVRYAAGYGDAGTDVDPGIRQALLMTVASMYDARESGLTINEQMARRLFSPYRVYC